MRIFHPKADISHFSWRLFIANSWAPGLVWISVVLAIMLVFTCVQFKIRLSQMVPAARRSIVCTALVILPSLFLEYYEPRYFIYVLPSIILSFLIVLSFLLRTLPRFSTGILVLALNVCMIYGVKQYYSETTILSAGGERITAANRAAVSEALAMIHSHFVGKPRIYSTVTAEAVAMDDSCILITPIMYYQPIDAKATREELWERANINYAIVCNPAHNLDWNETDSCIAWLDRSHAKIIFEQVGPFWDIGRSYQQSDLILLDTLRVYEFR